jgi:tetratricopeptide (TPR) repeat protein
MAVRRAIIAGVDSGNVLAWRSAVVPVPARGVVRVPGADGAATVAAGPGEESWLAAVTAIVDWCESDEGPLWLVEGPTGSGKTQLATEVANRLSALGWPCGWARPGLGTYAVTAAARNGRRALVLVDDAETRADLGELLRTLANGGSPLPVRVVVLTRELGPWWQTTFDRLTAAEQAALAPATVVLGGGRKDEPSPRALALRSLDLVTTGSKAQTVAMLAAADPASGAVLLRQAALVVALSTRVGQLGPAEVRAALRDLFEEEEGYWRQAAAQVSTPGQPNPSLRSALAASAVAGADGLGDAATVLRRVPTLAVGAADRLARLAMWWHGLYSRTGNSSVATPQLPAWLADRLPDGTAASASSGVSWTVAALDAERRATSTLARLTLSAHRDIWPHAARAAEGSGTGPDEQAAVAHDSLRRGVESASPVDEALAWLSQELELTEAEIDSLGDAIPYPSRPMARTAIVLARRLLESSDDEGDQAAFLLSLGARYGELSQWSEARDHSEAAVAILRCMVERDRAGYLADLASAVGNLGSCLAHLSDPDAAVDVAYEAVALHRELVERDRYPYLPDLARSLANLSACLNRAGRAEAAVGAAGQSVVLYRELVEESPAVYQAELAAAEHNWRVCSDALADPLAYSARTAPAARTQPPSPAAITGS